MGNDVVNSVTLQIKMQNLASAEAAKFTNQLKAMGAAAKSVGNQVAGAIASPLGGVVSVVGVVAGIQKALSLAKQSQLIHDQLGVALGGNVTQLREVETLTQGIADKSYFSADQLGNAAERLLERGVKLKDIPKSLQVVADVAAALHIPLDEAADSIAQTFGGTVPRALGHSVPALHGLTKEALESGAALDLLSKKFNGRAAEESLTESGRAIKAARDIEVAWKDVGTALLPIEQTILPAIAKQFQNIAEPFKADTIVSWADVLKEAVAQILGDANFVDSAVAAAINDMLKGVTDAFDVAGTNIKFWALDLLGFIVNHFKTEIRDIAVSIDNLTSHAPSWLGGKTQLTHFVDSSLSNGLDAEIAKANKAAQAASDRLNADIHTNVFSDALDAGVQGRDDTIAKVEKMLGAGDGQQDKITAQQAAQKQADAAAAAKQRITDAENEKDALESLLNVRREVDQEKGEDKNTAALDQLKTKYDAGEIALEDYYAKRRQLETAVGDLEITNIVNQIGALTIKAAKEKLAGQPATDSLTEIHDLMVKLLPLEDQRAAVVAKTADEYERALKAQQKQNDEADKEKIRSTEDAIRTLGEDAKKGVGEVAEGSMTPEEFKQSLTDQLASVVLSLPSTFAAIDGLVRDHILSEKDGQVIKDRIDGAVGHVTVVVDKAKKSVDPLISDLDAIGEAGRKAATSGLAESLTEWETGAKNASQAFGDMAKSIIKSMLDIANQKIAQHMADALFGPDENDKPGKGGGGGSPVTGGLFGALGSMFSNGSNGSPSIATSAINATTGAIESAGTAIGNVASGAASEVGSAVGWLAQVAGSLFATGGYTGAGHPSTPAGIVHKGEFVLPAHRVSAIGLDTLNLLHSGRINSLGRSDYRPNVAGIMSTINANGGMGGSGATGDRITSTLNKVNDTLESVADAQSRPNPAVVLFDAETTRQWVRSGSTPPAVAQMMKDNPSIFGPVITRLGK